MKIVFFSDAHGSVNSIRQLKGHIDRINPDCIAFLGDALYHGPRNRIKSDYDPRGTADIFNGMKDRIIAVRGNCDSEVDQMMFAFPILSEYSNLFDNARRFFMSHGHHWSHEKLPPLPAGSVFAFGHTHIPKISRNDDGIILFNPGSISLPKNDMPDSFGLYDGCRLSVLNLITSGEILGMDLS